MRSQHCFMLPTKLYLYSWSGKVLTFYYRYWYSFHQNYQHFEVWDHLVLFIFAFSEPNTVPNTLWYPENVQIVLMWYIKTPLNQLNHLSGQKALALKIYFKWNQLEGMICDLTPRVPLFIHGSLCHKWSDQ